jgi:hypothetical protein
VTRDIMMMMMMMMMMMVIIIIIIIITMDVSYTHCSQKDEINLLIDGLID